LEQINLVIQQAVIDDALELVNFWQNIGQETDFLTCGSDGYAKEEEEKIVSDSLKLQKSPILIGRINDIIISQIFLQRSINSRTKHAAYIEDVAVYKKYWGKGIASQMMHAAIFWAYNNNITKLGLYVDIDNDRAIKLYNKFGFVIEGKIRRAMKINDHYTIEYLMGLLL
jgi:RimJ/RimL family protein N-acetyltransferase